jgi:DNA-binding LytR/AlgR family response regulator
LLQTAKGEAVVDYGDLDYFESARNYVSVFAGGREYLTRNTMNGLLESLADDRFVRTHRSFAVNVDKVAEIRSVDSAYIVRMHDGRDVPLSRRYRDVLRGRIA